MLNFMKKKKKRKKIWPRMITKVKRKNESKMTHVRQNHGLLKFPCKTVAGQVIPG